MFSKLIKVCLRDGKYKNCLFTASKFLIMDCKNAHTIAVFGATGAQGGAVVHALVGDKHFKVRAITRNANSDSAKILQSKGAEVVSADLDDKASLVKALKDVHGVFLVTDFFQSMDQKKEFTQGKNAVDAAKENHVKHFVFSGLEHIKIPTGWAAPHFDSKAEIEDYIKTTGLPYTFVHYSFYMENILKMMPPRKTETGEYSIDIPMGSVAMDMVPVEEAGECIKSIFLHKDLYLSKTIGLSSDKKTIDEYAKVLHKHFSDKKFIASKVTPKEYAHMPGMPPALADDLASMFNFYQVGKFDRDIAATRKLNPKISDFDHWVGKHTAELKKAIGD